MKGITISLIRPDLMKKKTMIQIQPKKDQKPKRRMCSTCPRKKTSLSNERHIDQLLEIIWRKMLMDLLRVNPYDRMSINEMKNLFKDVFDLLGINNLFSLRKSLTENINSNYLKTNLKLNNGSSFKPIKEKENSNWDSNNYNKIQLYRSRNLKKKYLNPSVLNITNNQLEVSSSVIKEDLKYSSGFYNHQGKKFEGSRTMKLQMNSVKPTMIGYDELNVST